MTRPTKPRVWKAGHECWVAANRYYCEELGEKMYTIMMFRTWRQAMQCAREQL